MPSAALEDLFADGRRNAVASWLLVALASVVWLTQVLVSGLLWSVFALVVVLLAVLPPVAYRSRSVMLPWEVLALATLPLIGLAIGNEWFSSPLFTYVAVATVALVIVVELNSFTSIRMSPGFAIGLVAVATMAAAAAWELLQWYVAILLDRTYDTTNDEMMIEFLYSALAGFAAGVVFRTYFRRRVSLRDRVPQEFETEVSDD